MQLRGEVQRGCVLYSECCGLQPYLLQQRGVRVEHRWNCCRLRVHSGVGRCELHHRLYGSVQSHLLE